MASANHSLVTGKRIQTVSSTSTATSIGTKKIRRMVRALGIFIDPKSTIIRAMPRQQLRQSLYLIFDHACLAPLFLFWQLGSARSPGQEKGRGPTPRHSPDPGG